MVKADPKRPTEHLADDFLLRCAESEQQLIAGFWIDPRAGYDAAKEYELGVETFTDVRLGFVFGYLCRCSEQSVKPKVDVCLREAETTGFSGLDSLDYGWLSRMVHDTDSVPGAIRDYAREVSDRAKEREGSVADAIQTLVDAGVDAPKFIPPTDSLPFAGGPPWLTAAEVCASPRYGSGLRPIPTGYDCLNEALAGGFRPECVYVLGGRTGSAKSTLALNIARRAALEGTCTLVFKLEETPMEGVWRMNAAASHLDFRLFLDGGLPADPTERRKLDDGREMVRTLPIRLTDCSGVESIQRIAREHVRTGGKLIVVDQLSKVAVEGADLGYARATLASNALRSLAVSLRVPIVVVVQVNRAAAKTSDTPLSCHDLRDSGEIENDAAGVILIDRVRKPDHVWRSAEPVYELDLIVGKNRYGPLTDPKQPITLEWFPRWCRIDERERIGGGT